MLPVPGARPSSVLDGLPQCLVVWLVRLGALLPLPGAGVNPCLTFALAATCLRRYFRRALVYAQDMLASRAAQVGMKGVGLLSAVSRHTAKGSVSVGVKPSLWRSRMLSDASECCDLFCTRARVVFGGFSHLLAHHRRRHHRTTPDVALGFVLGAMPHRACAGSRVRGAAELLGCIQQEQQARVCGGMSFVVRSTCANAHAEICFVVCSCSQVPPACIHDYGATVRCSAGLC